LRYGSIALGQDVGPDGPEEVYLKAERSFPERAVEGDVVRIGYLPGDRFVRQPFRVDALYILVAEYIIPSQCIFQQILERVYVIVPLLAVREAQFQVVEPG
jgi:hypothetical protein